MTNMLTNMITCWKVKLKNGQLLCFTDSDQEICFENETYLCGSYFTPSKIVNSNELGQDNFSISGIVDENIIKRESLLAGDFAESYIEVFLVNLSNPEDKIILKTGWFGEIKLHKNSFTAQICSLGSKTNNVIGKCYSSSCRARFADEYCKINEKEYLFEGEVTGLSTENSFIDKNRQEPDDYFVGGIVTLSGRQYKVKEYRDSKITIEFVFNININLGDKYTILAGCDKSLHTCINKFDNAINFRGEPFIPNKHQLVC